MGFNHRKLTCLMLAGFTLFVAGCGSNNKDKIVGKWKLQSAPNLSEEDWKFYEKLGHPFLEFKGDGTVIASFDWKSPNLKELAAKGSDLASETGTYKLLSGDLVEFAPGTDGSSSKMFRFPKGKLRVTIDGDNMTITASDGSLSLVRMK